MQRIRAVIVALIVGFFFCSCPTPGTDDSSDYIDKTHSTSYKADSSWLPANTGGDSYHVYMPSGNENLSLTVSNIPDSKTAYLILTNESESSKQLLARSFDTSISGNLRVPHSNHKIIRDIQSASQFNANPWSLARRGATSKTISVPHPLFDTVDSSDNFYMYKKIGASESVVSIPTTCRLVRNVGGKTLNIWVADEDWGTNGAKITATMVTTIADKFLQTGTDNDIYDWINTIFGDEYNPGANPSIDPSFIADNDNITILIADLMEQDSPNGGVVGYFDARNEFKSTAISNTNQRVMFCIDAPMFANPSNDGLDSDTTWDPSDYWPKEIYSTLAHEFQHMIDFNQKVVQRNSNGSESWLTELGSAAAEDYVSYKLQISGIRGVTYSIATAGTGPLTGGRLPYFIDYPMTSLTAWAYGNSWDYAVVYAFASWLIRNYSAGIFTSIVQCADGNSNAVVAAVHANGGMGTETFSDLLRKWGVACLLSSDTTASSPFRYNKGSWTTPTIGGLNFNLGSINLNNYQFTYSGSNPYIQNGLWILNSIPRNLERTANAFILLQTLDDPGSTKTASLSIKLPSTVSATVVVK